MDLGFTWSDKYSINIELIDDQHKKLIDMFQKLYTDLNREKPLINSDEWFLELAQYANYHFQTEENLFKAYNYPEAEAHTEEHHQFVQELLLLYHHSGENQQTLPLQIYDFLHGWLQNHVFGTDQQFGRFLKQNSKP
jgi:hemerythrin